ncbi:Mitochondrial/chloroplast ribosomal protein S9 [Ceraceosorus bombacis]|uniref:Mitochondrial/chloroplast ribosomal protein S9 n=1 Tax=Ceraceosorus bombacis TaxID=401625 RepID=A0A0P1BGI8_9BASI|nr:Mitochondrial/chloroplast ribosomal protein S9 [Ceraceosorus bombacis]
MSNSARVLQVFRQAGVARPCALGRSVAYARRAASTASSSTATTGASEDGQITHIPASLARPGPREATLPPARLKPVSPSHFTGRPQYIDAVLNLEDLIRQSKRALQQTFLVEPHSNPPPSSGTRWLTRTDLSNALTRPLKASEYRNLTDLLATLGRWSQLLQSHFASGQHGHEHQYLADKVGKTLQKFVRKDQAAAVAEAFDERGVTRASSHVDELGRAYARGRRKDASARVWIIPVKTEAETETAGASGSAQSATPPKPALDPLSIQINNRPLSHIFTNPIHRESVLYPLRLASALGAFNVFAISRGGGSSGQAGAVAHGIANCLLEWYKEQARLTGDATKVKDLAKLLHKDGIIRRDPRVVERKKTGLAKARKAYTWVKR